MQVEEQNLGKMGCLEAHTELVAETELEYGILDFLPIHIFQAQTPSLCIYLRYLLSFKATEEV